MKNSKVKCPHCGLTLTLLNESENGMKYVWIVLDYDYDLYILGIFTSKQRAAVCKAKYLVKNPTYPLGADRIVGIKKVEFNTTELP